MKGAWKQATEILKPNNMYQARVLTVSIPSSGVALEEEHIAREVIARWNIEEGEKHGVVFLTIPNNYRGITPDIFIFAIDNYVDEQKVETAIQTGAKVILFFRSHHDEKNTMESEVNRIGTFREKLQGKCICVDYNNNGRFEEVLINALFAQANK